MGRILIAEDDSSMRQFLAMALRRAGHDVILCEDGQKAFDILRSSPDHPDLLLTDIVMPGMDGIELSKKVAALYPDIKILFITGFAAVAAEQRKAQNVTPANILAKPFHLNDLTRQVEALLNGGETTESS